MKNTLSTFTLRVGWINEFSLTNLTIIFLNISEWLNKSNSLYEDIFSENKYVTSILNWECVYNNTIYIYAISDRFLSLPYHCTSAKKEITGLRQLITSMTHRAARKQTMSCVIIIAERISKYARLSKESVNMPDSVKNQ